jgi:hypothetical protein
VTITYNDSPTPPSAAGSHLISATITDPNYQGSATATLLILSGDPPEEYEEWATVHFSQSEIESGLASPDGDADGDGTPNLAELYLGLDPRDPNSRLAISLDSSAQKLAINRVVTSGQFVIQTSGDLAGPWLDWLTLDIEEDGEGHVVAIPPPSDKLFFRLRYTPPTDGPD